MLEVGSEVELQNCATFKTLHDRQQTSLHHQRLEQLTRELTIKETQIQHYIRKELKNRNQLETLQAKNDKLHSTYTQLSRQYEELLEVLRNIQEENAVLKKQALSMNKSHAKLKELREDNGKHNKQREAADDQHVELLEATFKEQSHRNRELIEQLHESEEKLQSLKRDYKDLLIRKAEGDKTNEKAVKFVHAVHKALQDLNLLEPEEQFDIKRNWRILKDLLKRITGHFGVSSINHSFDCGKQSNHNSRSVGRLTRYRSK